MRFAEPLIARILEARFKANHKKLKRAVERIG
jgi:hypothetical protein